MFLIKKYYLVGTKPNISMKFSIPSVLIILCFLFTTSCKDNKKTCKEKEQTFTVAALDLFSVAFEYAFDPSTENCTAYKSSLEKFLKLAEDYRSCVPSEDLDDYDMDIEDSQDELDNLPC